MTAHAPLEIDNSAALGVPADAGFSVLELLTTLARRKKFLSASTLGAAIVLGGISCLMKPQYTAQVTLLPPQQTSSASSAALAQLGSLSGLAGGGLGMKSPVDMYVALMESAAVEDAMIKRFDLAKEYRTEHLSDTRKHLESAVHIEANPKDGLIRLALTDPSAPRAAQLANGYVEEYQRLSSTLAIGEAAQRRQFFEQQLERAKNKLRSAQEALKQTQQTSGLVELDTQARSLIQASSSLRAQITAKQVQLASLRVFDSEGNPDLIQAEEELRSLQQQLAKLGGGADGSDLNNSKGLPQAGLDYLRKVQDVKYNQMLFDILARQYEAARLDEAKEGSFIQIVDPGVMPDRKSAPKRAFYFLGGAFLGAFWGTLIVIFQASLERNQTFSRRYSLFKQALFH